MATLVSVVIPAFNRRQWIGECLESVLAQTYKNTEVLVVDDGSTDGTAEWIASKPEYAKVRVHIQQNSGASVARNKGIELANGELIVFIDSDDMLLPDHIEKAVAKFEDKPDLGLFCCDSKMIDAVGQVMFSGKTWHETLAEIRNYDLKTGNRSLEDVFLFSNCFPGFTLRKTVFDELGGFDQSLFPADDYDLALRVAGSRFKVYYLHEPLCLRREHDSQCSGMQNSVQTCEKIAETLSRAVERSPRLEAHTELIRRRVAEVEFDAGISEMKDGRTAHGARRVARSLVADPKQLAKAARIGGRKVRSLIKQ